MNLIFADYVCDHKVHCFDHSDEDEEYCPSLKLGPNYNKKYPPMPGFATFGKDHYLSLNTNIHILDIISINQDPGQINVYIKITLTWFDDGVRFYYLKDDHHRNPISNIIEKSIWIPKIGFTYLDDEEKTTFRNLVVEKNSKPIISGNITDLYPNYFYEGSQNALHLLTYQMIGFLCHFKYLSYEYPFGQDTCSLYIYFKDNDNFLATFNVTSLGFNKLLNLSIFL